MKYLRLYETIWPGKLKVGDYIFFESSSRDFCCYQGKITAINPYNKDYCHCDFINTNGNLDSDYINVREIIRLLTLEEIGEFELRQVVGKYNI